MRNIKKLMLLSGGLTLALGCGVAFSQSHDSQQDPQQNQQRREHFEDTKQKMTQRIQDRIGKMQRSLDCVQNAQDRESLRACIPEGGGRDSGGSGMRRGGRDGFERDHGGGRNEGGDGN